MLWHNELQENRHITGKASTVQNFLSSTSNFTSFSSPTIRVDSRVVVRISEKGAQPLLKSECRISLSPLNMTLENEVGTFSVNICFRTFQNGQLNWTHVLFTYLCSSEPPDAGNCLLLTNCCASLQSAWQTHKQAGHSSLTATTRLNAEV